MNRSLKYGLAAAALVLTGAALVVLGALWWTLPSADTAPSAASAPSPSSPSKQPTAPVPQASAVPADQTAAATRPSPGSSLARLAARAETLAALARWQSLHRGAATPARQALAEEIIAALPGRLDRREIGPAEAMLIHMAVMEDTAPIQERREAQLAVLRQHLEAYTGPAFELAGPQAAEKASAPPTKDEIYRQRQSEILTRWMRQPPEQRDPKALEAELDQAHKAVFGQ